MKPQYKFHVTIFPQHVDTRKQERKYAGMLQRFFLKKSVSPFESMFTELGA